jgi:threonyl-tRNA synthetase
MRVRAFTQDDAHIFCTEAQIEQQCVEINQFMLAIYADFGFRDVHIKLATRPEQRVGADDLWDKAEEVMKRVLSQIGADTNAKIRTSIAEGEGAFYGPKFEYHLRDAIGRTWQCGTTQVDFNLPSRFGAFYIDADGEKKTPVMIHRAMFGSLERFIGILTENVAGHFPLWLAPEQIKICTITQEANDYAEEVAGLAMGHGLRAQADLRNEKISYKVREHSVAKTPVIFALGKREAEERTVSIRRLGSPDQTVVKLEEALKMLALEAVAPDQR